MSLVKGEKFMILKTDKLEQEKEKILNFLLNNKEHYNSLEFFNIFSKFYLDIFNEFEKEAIFCNYSQILSKYNIIKEEFDIYLKVYNLLESKGFIKGDILEVGCGIYPRLAEIITKRHKEKDYSLTLYDICNIFNISKDITIVRDKFTRSTNINRYDTLVGIHPCEASIDLTLKGIEENKNLIVAFCGCNHETVEFPKWYDSYWSISFCSDIKEMYGDRIEIIDFEDYPKRKLPILIHKKRISR